MAYWSTRAVLVSRLCPTCRASQSSGEPRKQPLSCPQLAETYPCNPLQLWQKAAQFVPTCHRGGKKFRMLLVLLIQKDTHRSRIVPDLIVLLPSNSNAQLPMEPPVLPLSFSLVSPTTRSGLACSIHFTFPVLSVLPTKDAEKSNV